MRTPFLCAAALLTVSCGGVHHPGTPVAVTAPTELSGRSLVVDFTGAMACNAVRNETDDWKPTQATPLVVQFPAGEGTNFKIQLDEPTPANPELGTPNSVTYSPQGNMAVLTIVGRMRYVVLTLNFNTPDSGKASLSWSMDESGWLARDATFSLQKATSPDGRVELPKTESQS